MKLKNIKIEQSTRKCILNIGVIFIFNVFFKTYISSEKFIYVNLWRKTQKHTDKIEQSTKTYLKTFCIVG